MPGGGQKRKRADSEGLCAKPIMLRRTYGPQKTPRKSRANPAQKGGFARQKFVFALILETFVLAKP
jgi:hypothetical protein